MRCFKKSLSLLIAILIVATSVVAYAPSKISNVVAAGNKLEYISFNRKTQFIIYYDREVKNGNYYVRVQKDKIQVKNGKNGKYKTTKIKAKYQYGAAGNGKFLYYIQKENSGNVLKRYNYKTEKIEKVAKIPFADSMNSIVATHEESKIIGTCGNYIFFSCINDSGTHVGEVMYSFNVKTKEFKSAGLNRYGFECTSGKYCVVTDNNFSAKTCAFDLYKFKKDGTLKKIKRITKNARFVHLYNNTLYWIYIPKNNSGKNVLYSMKVDGTGKQKLFTATKKYPIYEIGQVSKDKIIMTSDKNVGYPVFYIYDFKTKKITINEEK